MDEMTQHIWANMGRWEKFRVGGAAFLQLFGALGAIAGVFVAFVDGGATYFAANSVAHAVAAYLPGATALAGAGIGGVGAAAGFALGALKVNTLPFLSRFFAIACDCFGLPRVIEGKANEVVFGQKPNQQKYSLPNAKVSIQPVVSPLIDGGIYQETESLGKLRNL